jgi:hypothetical protein
VEESISLVMGINGNVSAAPIRIKTGTITHAQDNSLEAAWAVCGTTMVEIPRFPVHPAKARVGEWT